MTRQSTARTMVAYLLSAASVALAGCDVDNGGQPDPASPAQQTTSSDKAPTPGSTVVPNHVAEAVVATGAKVQIAALDDGSFLITQSGRMGTEPMIIPDGMLEQADPIALFKYMAPGQAVPQTLVTANERSLALLKTEAVRKPIGESESAQPISIPASRPQINYADNSQSNWTGYSGCPVNYFNTNFCTTAPYPFCYYNAHWASYEHPNAFGGWGAVCADSGQLTFRITAGTVSEYTVDQGSWRSGQILHKRTCNFWGCDDVRFYLRFEMMNRPDSSSGHFASEINY
jgi:hypothetical protein